MFLTASDMKNELLKMAWSVVAENPEEALMQRQSLLLLLNKETISFEFPLCFSAGQPGERAEFNHVWQGLLATYPVNLRSLVKRSRCIADRIWNLGPFVDQILVSFVNLEVLEIGHQFRCNDADLARFAEHMPKLR